MLGYAQDFMIYKIKIILWAVPTVQLLTLYNNILLEDYYRLHTMHGITVPLR